MSSAAVRAWLVSTLTPLGLAVYDEPLIVLPQTDYLAITRFPQRRQPYTFGSVGSLKEVVYTPSVLVVLINPSNDANPQRTLDGYVNGAIELLEKAPTPASITDPVTSEVSLLGLVTDITVDPPPQNTLAATVIVPTLTELATEAA